MRYQVFGLVVASMCAAVPAPPVLAQDTNPLLLVCEPREIPPGAQDYPFSVRIKIDRVNRTVELQASGGTVLASTTDRRLNARPPTVQITESKYSWKLSNNVGFIFEGSIDRQTRDVWMSWLDARNKNMGFTGRCREATTVF